LNPPETLETLGVGDYLPYPQNIRELSDLFPILWQQIRQEEIDNLIRRIREVIRVRGRNTDYLKLKQKLFKLILFLFDFKGFTFF
jgi:parvulin-like peptidyl-prolyl isomerase